MWDIRACARILIVSACVKQHLSFAHSNVNCRTPPFPPPRFLVYVLQCSDRFLPDKAIDLIDEAGSRVRLQHAQVNSTQQHVLCRTCMSH